MVGRAGPTVPPPEFGVPPTVNHVFRRFYPRQGAD
jgi:hypothetical protein